MFHLKAEALEELRRTPVTGAEKGIPGYICKLTLGEIGKQSWNLLRGDLPLPVAVLRQSAIHANRAWLRQFVVAKGLAFAPHGKTTMAPQLLKQQLEDGAWGVTAATADQVAVYRRFGASRILLANQLVGQANIGYVLREIERDREFDFYCLVDSIESAVILENASSAIGASRPLQVLIELGVANGRTGLRCTDSALALAHYIRSSCPHLGLRGIECYEGVVPQGNPAERESRVSALIGAGVELAAACHETSLFAANMPVILSAGGSEYYDLVGVGLSAFAPGAERIILLRSGCYLTQDHLFYTRAFRRLLERSPELNNLAPHMGPALEVWGVVQSIPEPSLAIATVGKRDISHDFELPAAIKYFRAGVMISPAPLENHQTIRLNDQHIYCCTPEDSPLKIGDLIAFGVSHPCTTFDKWRIILVVDDDYNVIDAIRTFF